MTNASYQNGPETARYNVESETVDYNYPPPPPYSLTDNTVPTTDNTVPTVTAITHQPIIQSTVIVQPMLRQNPTVFNCPTCHKRIITRVIYINTRKTHMVAGFICGFTCWCLLCCLAVIPYIIPTFKKAEHYCPNCNTFLGTYSV